jgi:serine/threonine protein kinase
MQCLGTKHTSITELAATEYRLELDNARNAHEMVTEERRTKGFHWLHFRPRDKNYPPRGWKLHCSLSAADMRLMFREIIPKLFECRVAFKIPKTLQGLLRINAGLAGYTQVGKILTIYPEDESSLRYMIASLATVNCSFLSPFPQVVTDLCFPEVPFLFTRFGSFSGGDVEFDAIGRPHSFIAGTKVVDQRSLVGIQSSIATDNPAGAFARPVVDLAKSFTIDAQRYLPLKTLYWAPKGHVQLALCQESISTVIAKHARAGVLGDVTGKDAVARLRNEARYLMQMESRGIGPRLIDVAKDGATIVVEDLGGETLDQLEGVDLRLQHLANAALLLARMHKLGWVHRDVKSSNILASRYGTRLIDFELTTPIGTLIDVGAGTEGYLAPEITGAIADPSLDVFSLGSSLFEVATGVNPARLPRGQIQQVMSSILHAASMFETQALVAKCQHAAPEQRPSAQQFACTLKAHKSNLLKEAAEFQIAQTGGFDTTWIPEICHRVLRYVRKLRADSRYGYFWRNEHIDSDHVFRSINQGAAGVLIGLVTVSKAWGLSEFDGEIAGGADWLAKNQPDERAAGLFTGNAGIALALSLVGHIFDNQRWKEAAREYLSIAINSCGADTDLFSGCAGVIWAAIAQHHMDGDTCWLNRVRPLVQRILTGVDLQSDFPVWQSSNEFDPAQSSYFGVAHGALGTLSALIMWANQVGEIEIYDDSKRALLKIAETMLANTSNVFTLANSAGLKKHRTYWCHGQGGSLWSLLATDTLISIAPHLQSFLEAAPPASNATMCHGLSGVLENLRLCQRLPMSQNRVHFSANFVAELLRSLLVQVPETNEAFWFTDDSESIAPDLWVGTLAPPVALSLWQKGFREAVLSPQWFREMIRFSLGAHLSEVDAVIKN